VASLPVPPSTRLAQSTDKSHWGGTTTRSSTTDDSGLLFFRNQSRNLPDSTFRSHAVRHGTATSHREYCERGPTIRSSLAMQSGHIGRFLPGRHSPGRYPEAGRHPSIPDESRTACSFPVGPSDGVEELTTVFLCYHRNGGGRNERAHQTPPTTSAPPLGPYSRFARCKRQKHRGAGSDHPGTSTQAVHHGSPRATTISSSATEQAKQSSSAGSL
jgi:hypothetical protein